MTSSEPRKLTRKPGKYFVQGRRKNVDSCPWIPINQLLRYSRYVHEYPETAVEELQIRGQDPKVKAGLVEIRSVCVIPAEGDEQNAPPSMPVRTCAKCSRELPVTEPGQFHPGCAIASAKLRDPAKRPTIAELARAKKRNEA